MSEGQSIIPDHADRYLLYAIGLDTVLDVQLDAIQNLARRHQVAAQYQIDETKRAEERARFRTALRERMHERHATGR